MKKSSGFYIYGAEEAGWMGAIDGPFNTEELAIKKAMKWNAPRYDEGQLEIRYSETGENV
jgi:hypothetical protein